MKTKLEVLKECLLKFNKKISNIEIEEIKNISIDSRNLKENDLFFAINNGNNYINEAITKGALVISDKKTEDNYKNVVYVDDTVSFMQYFASEWRKNLETKIIAITGSNGKTTVKDILSALLSSKYNVFKTYKNYNSYIGVPLTILGIETEHDFAVVELGTSEMGQIEKLAKIVLPDYSIITNIGYSHLESFIDRESIYYEKTSIISYTKNNVFINGRDKYLRCLPKNNKIVRINDDIRYIDNISIIGDKMNFDLVYDNYYTFITTNIVGEHNAINMLLSFTCALFVTNSEHNEKQLEKYEKILSNIKLTEMRMEIIKEKGVNIVNDAYNSSPSSLKYSLLTFDKMYNRMYKIAVIGSMLELGKDSKYYHRGVLDILLETNIDMVVFYGKEFLTVKDEILKYSLPIKFLYVDIDEDLIKDSFNISQNNDNIWLLNEPKNLKKQAEIELISEFLINTYDKEGPINILFKGSRGVKLELVINKFMEMLKNR